MLQRTRTRRARRPSSRPLCAVRRASWVCIRAVVSLSGPTMLVAVNKNGQKERRTAGIRTQKIVGFVRLGDKTKFGRVGWLSRVPVVNLEPYFLDHTRRAISRTVQQCGVAGERDHRSLGQAGRNGVDENVAVAIPFNGVRHRWRCGVEEQVQRKVCAAVRVIYAARRTAAGVQDAHKEPPGLARPAAPKTCCPLVCCPRRCAHRPGS